ncbi:5-methyltetrahydropteroyltriglutamate--homocysteine S-methyltransferase [Vagococcus entomophilus]|uniref:5-methyltetrahydropteroyltriglutamate--homocysteine methyltransferase n=1 Tax=Vagococcus entomophilus TaxID=1160095 RepID=A0A430AGG6_9ENTE|nr:5-methyltetrahydropteroyltriglutamate--homocysteine S-methyltransferase [Vagococcus entomophilus]RSU07012.1 5-methyltetrahydropteroyltriglutamate--homocysteine methyltransferase [Vagococcus entomophilus]
MTNKTFSKRTTAPFRFDIVGSFLRPEKLKQARADFDAGKIDFEALTKIEDEEIRGLVAKEKAAGLQGITDGEFRRSYWHLDYFWGFSGVEHNTMSQGYLFHGEETRADSARLNGKIRFTENHPFLAHYKFLKEVVGKEGTARQSIPAPAQFFAELVRAENEEKVNEFYPDRAELYEDISKAYRESILAFYELGCRNIQLDDCTWGMLCDEKFWSNMANGEYDVQALQELYLKLNNDAIADLPEDLVVNTHVCRGNYHSTWATSGGYAPVAETLFGNENVQGFYLEYDDDRSGGFEPLSHLPEGKQVVLGLVTSKSGKLEDKEVIKKRIAEAAKVIPLDDLCLSPQCGFASTEEGNILSDAEQWAKIELIKEIAAEVWGI